MSLIGPIPEKRPTLETLLIGAIGMGPIGFLVSKGDHIQFVSSRPPSGLNAVIERVPELVERYMTKKKTEDPAA